MAGSEFTGETSEGSRKKANEKHSTLGLEAVEAEEIVEKEMMDNAGKKRKCRARDEIQSTVPAHKNEDKSLVLLQTGTTSTQTHMTAGWKMTESDKLTTKPERRETEDRTEEECVVATVGHISGSKLLVLLQVNCRSICNKILEFWNLIDTYNPDVVMGTESWLSGEINNAKVFRDDYITFRRDRCSRGGGVFICIKNYIDCRVLWTDEVFEMIAIEVKGRNPKFAWEVIGIYRAPKEDMRVIERLAAQTGFTGNSTKRSIIGGDINLPYPDWNGNAGGNSGTQALINSLVWENGYSNRKPNLRGCSTGSLFGPTGKFSHF